MDLDRLSTGEKIAGASGVLLFIFMFFDWFTVDVSGGNGVITVGASAGGNAWDALELIPIFLLITIVVAVGVAVIRLSDAVFEPAISVNAVVAIVGGVSALLILYRIIDPPGAGSVPGLSVDVSPAFGIFISLLAAAGIAYGGYRAMQEEGASFSEIGDRLSGGGGPGAGPGATGGGSGQPPASTTPPPPPPPGAGSGGPPSQ
jgi:uncharacterized membrane protein YhaH (DUF805 family)